MTTINHPRFRRSNRTAFTLMETGVALFLLTACFVALLQFRSITMTQQHRLNNAETALHTLQNVLEIIGDMPDEQIISGDFSKEKVEQLAANTLPEGRIEFTIKAIVFHNKENEANDSDITVHLLRTTVFWSDGANVPGRSLALDRLLPTGSPPVSAPAGSPVRANGGASAVQSDRTTFGRLAKGNTFTPNFPPIGTSAGYLLA